MIAIIIAIASWFQPASEPEAQATEQQFSEQEVTEAKEAMCEAWDKTYKALQTIASEKSDDPVVSYALGIESRLAFHASGDYILAALQSYPATPNSLADALGELASSYHDLVLARISESPEATEIKARMDAAELVVREDCE